MNLITLPSDFASNIGGTASTLISDFSPYITLVVGVLLAMVAIAFIINAFHKH